MCLITHSHGRTHGIVCANLVLVLMCPPYGVIEVMCSLYCPSIEDNIHRYAVMDSYQVFFEPEGLSSGVLYFFFFKQKTAYEIA
ncbi:tRNA uridine 5-carboxymethylaminomethyl modification enzyme MnmG [Pseudomonas fluorescens]|nr:tRNA uridine 5-carboxymethylaminomethyl modification enzyme MnmG [Pseudomonas fluorescens]